MEENDNADHFSPNNINVLEKALSKMTKKCVNSFKYVLIFFNNHQHDCMLNNGVCGNMIYL